MLARLDGWFCRLSEPRECYLVRAKAPAWEVLWYSLGSALRACGNLSRATAREPIGPVLTARDVLREGGRRSS